MSANKPFFFCFRHFELGFLITKGGPIILSTSMSSQVPPLQEHLSISPLACKACKDSINLSRPLQHWVHSSGMLLNVSHQFLYKINTEKARVCSIFNFYGLNYLITANLS